MQHWNLTLKERVFLLKMWILPVLVYPARVIFPVKKVVDSLKTIYNIALGLNSWGLTQDILALPESQGGLSLVQPHYFFVVASLSPFRELYSTSCGNPPDCVCTV